MTLEFKSMVRSPNSSRWCDTENTQGEVEAAICKMMSHFEQEYYGRGPNEIRAYLVDNLLIVRLQGVLTAAEKNLVKSADGARSRDLIKQFRTQLIEVARPALERLIEDITDVKILSLHHDISTKTGEEVVLFTLASSPRFRDSRKR